MAAACGGVQRRAAALWAAAVGGVWAAASGGGVRLRGVVGAAGRRRVRETLVGASAKVCRRGTRRQAGQGWPGEVRRLPWGAAAGAWRGAVADVACGG